MALTHDQADKAVVEETIAQVGEFELIEQMTGKLIMPPAVSIGPGDDAAVFLVNGSAVTTVDMHVEGVHFRRDWSSATQIGRKVVAASVADLEAMGARPVAMVVAFGAPTDLPSEWVRDFTAGLLEEAQAAGIALVGGDISRAPQVVIAITAFGQTEGVAPVTRGGARPGDLVAVCGRLGWAAAGLAALARGFRSPRAAVDAHRLPQVPYGQGRRAADAGATAMIDISDGLLADLGHVATASQASIDLESTTLPVPDPVNAVAAAIGRPALEFILTGGEDHALVATFPPGDVPQDWLVIGRVLEAGEDGPRVTVDGEKYEAESLGWRHF